MSAQDRGRGGELGKPGPTLWEGVEGGQKVQGRFLKTSLHACTPR